MPLPASLRNRTGGSHRGGAAIFISLASPTGRRKTARLRRARAQGARTPGTGVVFRRGLCEPSGLVRWERKAHVSCGSCPQLTPRSVSRCACASRAEDQRLSPVCPHPASSPHRCFHRWVRPQPELSLQLVYPWGAAVACGYWQGTPGGYRLKFWLAGPGPRSGLKPGSRGGAPASGRRA